MLKFIKSTDFWENLTKTVKETEFPANIIGKLEANDASLELYYYFGKMFNFFDDIKPFQEKVKKHIEFLQTDVMGLSQKK